LSAAPSSVADALAGLRAYHLPEAPSWWPPAPGWWGLALLLLLAGTALAWWLARRRRRHAAYRQALHELHALRAALQEGNDVTALVRELSKLLRRYAIALFPQQQVAALSGEDWLRFLDRHADGNHFLQGAGRQLLDAPYRRQPEAASTALANLVEDWIHRNREVHR
jgi:hypothetical protein